MQAYDGGSRQYHRSYPEGHRLVGTIRESESESRASSAPSSLQQLRRRRVSAAAVHRGHDRAGLRALPEAHPARLPEPLSPARSHVGSLPHVLKPRQRLPGVPSLPLSALSPAPHPPPHPLLPPSLTPSLPPSLPPSLTTSSLLHHRILGTRVRLATRPSSTRL